MITTIDGALSRLAEKTVDNTQAIRQMERQRRHQVVDMYGVEYTRFGDNGVPASFYISISPDLVYLERFEFKLIIQPFASTSGSGTGPASVTVDDTSLSISNNAITPNPHNHTTQAHTHNLIAGLTLVNTDATDFRVLIEGIDVTPYLMAQYNGAWIEGEGIYPSMDIGRDYDILEVAGDMVAEGLEDEAELLTQPGYKLVQVTSAKPFQVTLVNYLKYSHMNR